MALKTYQHSGGWTIVPIHYSLDAEKTLAWVVTERAKFPTQGDWDREMECDMRSIAGNPGYPHWAEGLHLGSDVRLFTNLPLCLACDFNVDPMVWVVCQIVRRAVHILDEVVGHGVSVPALLTEFRNRYPSHAAELWIYGDAAGTNRNAQTAMSDYDLMRLGLHGYPVPVVWKVPTHNPFVKDRLAAVNRVLRDEEGRSWVKVSPRCAMFIQDMQEVVLDLHGGIFKVNDRMNPYHQRTHASDAVGYLVSREFPVLAAVMARADQKPRAPLHYGRLLGGL